MKEKLIDLLFRKKARIAMEVNETFTPTGDTKFVVFYNGRPWPGMKSVETQCSSLEDAKQFIAMAKMATGAKGLEIVEIEDTTVEEA